MPAYAWEAEEARDARDYALDHGDYDDAPDPSEYEDDPITECPDCGGSDIGVEPEDRSVGIFGTILFCESSEDCRWETSV